MQIGHEGVLMDPVLNPTLKAVRANGCMRGHFEGDHLNECILM